MATLTTSASPNPVPEWPQARGGQVQFHVGGRDTVERTHLCTMWNPVRIVCTVVLVKMYVQSNQHEGKLTGILSIFYVNCFIVCILTRSGSFSISPDCGFNLSVIILSRGQAAIDQRSQASEGA